MPVPKKITLSLESYKNMAGHSRYNVSDKKAGLKGKILDNKLGVRSQKELDDAETILLSDAYEFFLSKNPKQIKFDVKFLFSIHKYFLETLYKWAGQAREVDISRGKMMFASVNYLPSALKYLDQIFKENQPQRKNTKSSMAGKIAIIHNEFNVIHPFRDGNGRTIRLFIDLLLYSVGFKLVDWNSKPKNEYIHACIKGAVGNHKPMSDFILKRLKK